MPFIHLTLFIEAPIERVFDLCRSIDLHKRSMQAYGEVPVEGTITGLIKEGETITWKAKHLFKERRLKIKITSMKRPYSFVDEQMEGDFKMMKHEHFFKEAQNGTFLIDQFFFEAPYGTWGTLFSKIYLTRYMERLLEERNAIIKQVAESNGWKQYIDS